MKAPKSLDNMVRRALWATELIVLLRRRLGAAVQGTRVVVEFASQIEADEFCRLITKRSGRSP